MAMDSSSAQPHHQEIVESMLISRKKSSSEEKKAINRGDDVQSPKCPRCDSPNTKFCYYNNYSLSQPRYLCKSCRRYWTKGGTLRNVPVGGGCRKNRRSSSSSSSSPSSSKRSLQLVEDHHHHHHLPIIPSFNINPLSSSPSSYGSRHDLSLPFSCSSLEKQTNGRHLGLMDDHGFPMSTANPNYIPFSSDIFQNMYCMGDGINLGLGINNSGLNQEMGFFGELFNGASTAINTTTMKQEIGSNNNNNNNDMGIIREGDQISRGLWGFPCQSDNYNFGGDGNVDSGAGAGTGRHGNGSWNGIASSSSSSWHELLNTPLM